jgi:hypothetical protein
MNKLLLTLLLTLVNTGAMAASDDEYDKLQKKCGYWSARIFKEDWGNGIVSTAESKTVYKYSSHYNKNLNKCFYLLTSTTLPLNGINNKGSAISLKLLTNLNDNKEYGQVIKRNSDAHPSSCHFKEVRCHSEAEWDNLANPFMSD